MSEWDEDDDRVIDLTSSSSPIVDLAAESPLVVVDLTVSGSEEDEGGEMAKAYTVMENKSCIRTVSLDDDSNNDERRRCSSSIISSQPQPCAVHSSSNVLSDWMVSLQETAAHTVTLNNNGGDERRNGASQPDAVQSSSSCCNGASWKKQAGAGAAVVTPQPQNATLDEHYSGVAVVNSCERSPCGEDEPKKASLATPPSSNWKDTEPAKHASATPEEGSSSRSSTRSSSPSSRLHDASVLLAQSPFCSYVTRSWKKWIASTKLKHGASVLDLEYLNSNPLVASAASNDDDVEYSEEALTCASDDLVMPRRRRNKRKRKNARACVEELDMNPNQQFEKQAEEEESMQELKSKLNPTAPVRHFLLGNESTPNESSNNTTELDVDAFLHFIPDTIQNLHPRLNMLQVEYAWLLEESLYLYGGSSDEMYVFHYASPYLKIAFRKKQTIVAPALYADFNGKRYEIQRRLKEGHRRGPLMSRIMATIRFQNRCGGKNKKKQHQLLPLPLLMLPPPPEPEKMTAKSPPKKKKKRTPPEAVVAKRSPPKKRPPPPPPPPKRKKYAPSPVVVKRSPEAARTRSTSPRSKSGLVATKLSIPPPRKKQKTTQPANTAQIPTTTTTRPISEVLTNLEMEVAWLVEESCLINPIDGPLISFVQANASPPLLAVIQSVGRRWLPRMYRSHDPAIKVEFESFRHRVRESLRTGFRRPETVHSLPRDYVPPPVAIRVQQSYSQFLSS